jgi:HK97 family phage major capsid protein
MGKRRTSAEIAAEQAALDTELLSISELEEHTDDHIARSTAIPTEYATLEDERLKAVAYEESVELVRSRAANPANREKAFPAAPAVIVKTDPYEGLELIRANRYQDEDVLERAKYAIEQAPRHMTDIARAHVMKLVQFDADDENKQAALISRHLLLTGSPEYHEQFREYVKSGYPGELLRAAMSLTDANGGYLVPFTLDPTVILTSDGIVDQLRSISSVEQIATDSWNGVTSAGISTAWTAEGAEASDGSPTFGQPTIVPKKADAWVQGSYEMLADSGFAAQFGRLLQDAKSIHEGAAFATANSGATRPRGVIADVAAVTTSLVASATTNALVVGDVYRVKGSLRPRDKAQASWMANDAIYDKIRQFDTAGGSSFWANLHGDTPEELLGKATYEASTMQSAVTTAGLVLLCGNFKQFKIVDRVGMSVQYNPMVMGITNQRPTGSAGWYAFWRVGSGVTDPAAFRLLQLNSTTAYVALA